MGVMWARWEQRVAVCALLLTGGCYDGMRGQPSGADTDGGADDDAAGTDAGDDGSDPGDASCEHGAAGLAPMRRLTATQYENTIRDLFEGMVAPSGHFPQSVIHHDYTNNPAANIVSLAGAREILLAAEEVAEQVVDDLGAIVGCESGDAGCHRAFVRDLGRRAFRRPLGTAEEQQIDALFDAVTSDEGLGPATGTVVTLLLQSPQFLYLVEEGSEEIAPGVVALGDYEIASRLSYLLWDTMPDEALFAAAAAGELQDPDGIETQVRRMLADTERSGPALGRFVREWMHFDGVPPFEKSDELFPHYDQALANAMDEELTRFVQGVLWSDEPTLARLLTSRETQVDAVMASFYGMQDVGGDGQWTTVTLEGPQRAGLLARPALLAEHATQTSSAPIFRGYLVRTQLLCGAIPPPPPDAMANAPEYPPGATEREKSDILMQHMNCGGCHALMNPIGLGFEHYDAIGAWRDVDVDGTPVDARGEVYGGDPELAGEFDGVDELGERLAASAQVEACVTRELYRHALGLQIDQALACATEPLQRSFSDSGGDLLSLVIDLTRSDAFRQRVLDQEQGAR